MATINTKTAGGAFRLSGFGGIDRRAQVQDIENLRLRSDGSLERRCGYAHALTLGGTVRGVWSGSFGGQQALFAVADSTLYRLDLETGTATALGSLATSTGSVALFLCRGRLCCIDGTDIYRWDGATLSVVEPYVPLVANERGPLEFKTVYEPINLIGRKARFRFKATGSNSAFYFGYKLESISAVYNASSGSKYSTSAYRLYTDTYGNSYISFNSTPAAGIMLQIFVTLDSQYYQYSRVAACTRAVVYGGSYDDRILCFGGPDASEMFCSEPVSDAQIDEASIWGNTSGDFYFPLDCNFHVGDGQYPLRTACRHHDRLLIFTAGDTWMADFSASVNKHLPVVPINSGVGCTSPAGAALAGNNPLAVADGAIRRWTTSTLRRDECSAESVSDGIAHLFGAQFSTGAIAHTCRGRNEVWFADPSSSDGRVLVYHTDLEAWYRFSGIRADDLFSYGGDIGFRRGSAFYRFIEGRQSDLDTDGEHAIPVRLRLEQISLGQSERENRATRLALTMDGPSPALTVTATTDRGRIRAQTIAASSASGERLCDMPWRTGRFRALTLELTATGSTPLCLRGLALTAEPGENP